MSIGTTIKRLRREKDIIARKSDDKACRNRQRDQKRVVLRASEYIKQKYVIHRHIQHTGDEADDGIAQKLPDQSFIF